MANGGSRRGLYGEGRRTAVAAETHSPPHVQRGQTGPQRGRPVGRATRRKGDPSEGRPISEGHPSEGGPSEEIFRRRAKITKKKVFGSTAEIAARFITRRRLNPFAPSTANMSTEVATTPADPSPAGTTLTRRSLSRKRGCRGWLSVWFRPGECCGVFNWSAPR